MPADDTPTPLSLRHEQFAIAYCRHGGVATAAYRAVYPASRSWSDARVSAHACKLMERGDVRAEIARLRAAALSIPRERAVASFNETLGVLSDAMRCRLGAFLKEDGAFDLQAIRAAGPEIESVQVEERIGLDGKPRRKLRVTRAPLVGVVQTLARLMAWDREGQPAEVAGSARNAALGQAMDRAIDQMGPDEFAAWLTGQRQALAAREAAAQLPPHSATAEAIQSP